MELPVVNAVYAVGAHLPQLDPREVWGPPYSQIAEVAEVEAPVGETVGLSAETAVELMAAKC